MTKKPTYEELQQRIKGLEKEAVEHKRAKEELQTILNLDYRSINNITFKQRQPHPFYNAI